MTVSIIIPTRLESLNTELLIEIMEYLDAYNLISAFHGLNRRFNSLIRSWYLHVLFDESKRDTNIWNKLISFIDESRIRFLSFNNSDESIHKQFLHIINENLRSLSLQNINKPSMLLIFVHLPVVNQLKSLYINNCWYKITPRDNTIENFIFGEHGHRFTSLVQCSLVLMPYSTSFPSIKTIFPRLRRLSLNDSRWTSDTINFLFKNTPNLRSLRIRPYGNFSQAFSLMKVHLNHIRELEILLNNNTSELPSLLILFPGLRRLRIAYYETESCPVLNGKDWQKMIEDHFPHLQRMTLDFYDEDDNAIDEQFFSTFQAEEFWSERQVVIEMMNNQDVHEYDIIKKIYFGKPWAFDMNIKL